MNPAAIQADGTGLHARLYSPDGAPDPPRNRRRNRLAFEAAPSRERRGIRPKPNEECTRILSGCSLLQASAQGLELAFA